MGVDKILRVSVVGTGNVASHLLECLGNNPDVRLVSISTRTIRHAQSIKERLKLDVPVVPLDRLNEIETDLIIISVSDSGVEEVAQKIRYIGTHPLVVHTSGTLSRDILNSVSPRTGVLYPLQSFTAGNHVEISKVPFFIEAGSETDICVLENLVRSLNASSYHTDQEKRRILHISGVFTNNFVNIILLETEKLLKTYGMGLEVVEPLLRHTVDKALKLGPYTAMTGPARRGDTEVIEKQKEALPDELKSVYSTLTDVILQEFNEQN